MERNHWQNAVSKNEGYIAHMFSMTDIKAHTVYKIVMFLPKLMLIALAIFAYPFVSYMVGFGFADSLLMKVLLSIVAYVIIGIMWEFLVKAISFVLNELFYLLIDVSPSKGLNNEQSKAVLFGGQLVLDSWEFDKNIRNVSYEVVDRISRQGFFGYAFKDNVSKRLWAISEHYKNNPNENISSYTTNKVIEDLGLKPSWIEKSLNNAFFRNTIIQSLFFIYLLVEQPSF